MDGLALVICILMVLSAVVIWRDAAREREEAALDREMATEERERAERALLSRPPLRMVKQ